MNVEDVRRLVQVNLDDAQGLLELQMSRDESLNPWSLGYVTALMQVLSDMKNFEDQEQ